MTTKILLTGATGSFGKAFIDYCLQTTKNIEIYAMSRDECKQAALNRRYADKPVHWILGDVRCPPPLPEVDLVVHAAALKHVGRGELQPKEFVATNVLGSANMLDHALVCDCPFVGLSTDKACAPVNAYGATKMLMEKQTLAAGRSVVRYGNVLGSRGSLIPFVMQCVQNKASIPITDPEMTRFWLHLQDAVDLVISAWTDQLEGVSGIHVPLAPAMRVVDLVAALAPENATHYCGILPGEKLHEAMVAPDEAFCCYEWCGRLLLTNEIAPHEAVPVERGFTYTSDVAPQMSKFDLLSKLSNLDLVDNELVIRGNKCVSQ